MPRRALRCVAELSIHAITCPGVWLPRRDDVYLSVSMFGQTRRSQLVGPYFPLLVQEKFHFDKVFHSAYEPAHVATSLSDEPVVVELVQLSDVYAGGRLLASYECSASNFLYPYPSYSPTYGSQDRDVIMERSLDFPGISPRLEFATNTSIRETTAPFVPEFEDSYLRASRTRSPSPRRSRDRSRSMKRYKSPSRLSIGRPTVSSITRSRSVSPSRRLRMDGLNLESSILPLGESRPPFVVKKVSKNLIGRYPGTPPPMQDVTCKHGTYNYRVPKQSYAYTDDYLDLYRGNTRPCYTSKAMKSLYSTGYSCFDDLDDLDLDSLRISRRYRSPSPILNRSSLSDRFLDTSASSQIIKARVDAAIERNKTRDALAQLERERVERLERLDRMERLYDDRYRYPYGSIPIATPSYRYDYSYPSYSSYSSTRDLEIDLELARTRRRLYSDL